MPKVVLENAKFAVLGRLITQLRFESPSVLIEQSFRAEHLIKLIDPAKEYPYDFICYKITNFRPRQESQPQLISGAVLVSDLVTFIDQVAKQVFLLVDQLPEPAFTAKQLAQEIGVSTKTIRRWRRLGLAQRTIVRPDWGMQTYILKSTWDDFITKHERLVARAAAFNRMSAGQREWIISQARTLYQTNGYTRNQIELMLAEKTSRARETIRYVLNNHDATCEQENRVFPARTKLTIETCTQMYEMFTRGIDVEHLARVFGRSESTIYRIVMKYRQKAWQQAPIEYIYSPEFDLPSADDTILPGAEVQVENKTESTHVQTLEPAQERGLFRAYNYLKWKQDQHRKAYLAEPQQLIPLPVLDELEALQAKIDQIKDKLILANQALVISIAKRHLNNSLTFDELCSEGLSPLMKAVEKFDYTRGFKFSTYASWAVIKHFARVVPLAGQQQHQLLSDEDINLLIPGTTDIDEDQAYQRSIAIQGALEQLNERERHVLENRFGLSRSDEPLSLAQLGKRLGVTKERIRQIEAKAMDKLHTILKGTLPSDE